jgi:hypothetical protein
MREFVFVFAFVFVCMRPYRRGLAKVRFLFLPIVVKAALEAQIELVLPKHLRDIDDDDDDDDSEAVAAVRFAQALTIIITSRNTTL